jgi:hypothetical protein
MQSKLNNWPAGGVKLGSLIIFNMCINQLNVYYLLSSTVGYF